MCREKGAIPQDFVQLSAHMNLSKLNREQKHHDIFFITAFWLLYLQGTEAGKSISPNVFHFYKEFIDIWLI